MSGRHSTNLGIWIENSASPESWKCESDGGVQFGSGAAVARRLGNKSDGARGGEELLPIYSRSRTST